MDSETGTKGVSQHLQSLGKEGDRGPWKTPNSKGISVFRVPQSSGLPVGVTPEQAGCRDCGHVPVPGPPLVHTGGGGARQPGSLWALRKEGTGLG
jgi:hypothetical protein